MISRSLRDAAPLAAVAGEAPDCVFVALSYEHLANETPLLIERLRPLADDRSTFLSMEGRVHLAVYGLESDPREICEVPEVTSLVEAVLSAVPALAWYLALDEDLAPAGPFPDGAGPSAAARAFLFAGCVERVDVAGTSKSASMAMTTNAHYLERVETIIRGMHHACLRHHVPPERVQHRLALLAPLLGLDLTA